MAIRINSPEAQALFARAEEAAEQVRAQCAAGGNAPTWLSVAKTHGELVANLMEMQDAENRAQAALDELCGKPPTGAESPEERGKGFEEAMALLLRIPADGNGEDYKDLVEKLRDMRNVDAYMTSIAARSKGADHAACAVCGEPLQQGFCATCEKARGPNGEVIDETPADTADSF
jgi:hypothetical protein